MQLVFRLFYEILLGSEGYNKSQFAVMYSQVWKMALSDEILLSIEKPAQKWRRSQCSDEG